MTSDTPFHSMLKLRGAYVLTTGMLALSGFAQMPIFKRYYIADIPGLGWLGAYYTTHFLHYLFATVLLFLVAFALTTHLLVGRKRRRLTLSGGIQAAIVCGLAATGGLRVLQNREGYFLTDGWVVLLDSCHLSLALAFLGFGILRTWRKKGWTSLK